MDPVRCNCCFKFERFVKHCRNEMAKQPNQLQVEETNFAPSILNGPL